MNSLKKLRHLATAFSLASFVAILATACGSSDDNPNPDIVGDSGIPTTDATKDTTTPSDTTTPTDTNVGETTTTDTFVADGADTTPWDAASGLCFPGDPTNEIQFLDHCTDSTCIPYDNSKLTKLGAGGTLPPLP